METFYRVRKVAFCVLVIVIVLVAIPVLANPFDELKGGEVTFQGVCRVDATTLPCVEITNNGKEYIVFFDKEGECALFQKIHEKYVLLWSKTSI